MKIEGFFTNYKNANEAAKALRQSGFDDSYADLNEEDAPDMNTQTNLAGTELGPSLSDLVLGSGSNVVKDESKAPSLASNPMVSGMAGFEEIADTNYKVIVNIKEENQERAKKIIQEKGGDFLNPHTKEPKITGDADRIFNMFMEQLRNTLEQ